MTTPADNEVVRARIVQTARELRISPTEHSAQLRWRRRVEQNIVEQETLQQRPKIVSDRDARTQFDKLWRKRESHKAYLTKIRKQIKEQTEKIRVLETLSQQAEAQKRSMELLQETGYYTLIGISYCLAQNLLNNPNFSPFPDNGTNHEQTDSSTRKEE